MANSYYDNVLREYGGAPLPRGAMGQGPRAVPAARADGQRRPPAVESLMGPGATAGATVLLAREQGHQGLERPSLSQI